MAGPPFFFFVPPPPGGNGPHYSRYPPLISEKGRGGGRELPRTHKRKVTVGAPRARSPNVPDLMVGLVPPTPTWKKTEARGHKRFFSSRKIKPFFLRVRAPQFEKVQNQYNTAPPIVRKNPAKTPKEPFPLSRGTWPTGTKPVPKTILVKPLRENWGGIWGPLCFLPSQLQFFFLPVNGKFVLFGEKRIPEVGPVKKKKKKFCVPVPGKQEKVFKRVGEWGFGGKTA